MQNGGWVPISKYFADSLPRTRMFTELEAMYSLQLDYNSGNTITVLGCSNLWGWSRNKVIKFLSDNEIVINYPENAKTKKKKRGMIDIHPDKKRHKKRHKEDIKRTIKGHKRFIDSSWIEDKKDNKRTIKGHKKDNRNDTTNNPNIILNPNKTYSEDSKEFRLSVFLLNTIRQRKPDFKIPNLQTWSKQSDYILRIDRRDMHEIKKVVEWCQKDEFWQDNILSTAKLRKQYDQLVLKMNKSKPDEKQKEPKISFEDYKKQFEWKKENSDKIFNEDNLNKIMKQYPYIIEYDFESKKFELTYKDYLKL